MPDTNHNKIVAQAAREVLRPIGLFQKGQSRTWIDDNGWFFTVIEFQPSAFSKGSYLNVGACFLWSGANHLSWTLGGRVDGYAEFTGDENVFYNQMLAFARKAAKYAEYYRRFSDLAFAKSNIIAGSYDTWSFYDKMMICGLTKDGRAETYGGQLYNSLGRAIYKYEQEIMRELDEIAGFISDKEAFYEYVCGKITARRQFWSDKAAMKKMKNYNVLTNAFRAV